jgi:serine/threonine protein kinase
MTTHDLGTCAWLVHELTRGYILDQHQVEPVAREVQRQNPYADATAFAGELVRRQLITSFQAEKVLEGDAKSLLVGPYVLAASTGTSSMGVVYRAIGKADRAAYAIRVLPKRSTWNVRLARNQVRAFTGLPPHPAVVPFTDVGTAGGLHYLVWPFVAGHTLESIIRAHGPADANWLIGVALQIAEGLDICHRANIYHGLLKPTNVLIEGNDQAHILDFGMGALLAENDDESLIDTLSAANANSSMIDCACPESFGEGGNRGPGCDQYSLGCVLYFALTGQYPFPDGNMVQKMMAHQSQRPTPIARLNPKAPAGLISVIDRLLEKNPAGRFASTNELVATLRSLSTAQAGDTPTPLAGALTDSFVAPSRRSSSAILSEPPPLKLPQVQAPSVDLVTRWTRPLLFWLPTLDGLACTAFAPERLRLGESITILVFPHAPELIVNVASLARAQSAAVRQAIATPLTRPIPRGSGLAMHLTAGPLGVDPPLQTLMWRGSPVGAAFRLFAPRDCPLGTVTAVISLGSNNRLVGQIQVPLTLDPSKR